MCTHVRVHSCAHTPVSSSFPPNTLGPQLTVAINFTLTNIFVSVHVSQCECGKQGAASKGWLFLLPRVPEQKLRSSGLAERSFIPRAILRTQSPVLKCFHHAKRKPTTSLSYQSPDTDKDKSAAVCAKNPLWTFQTRSCVTACFFFPLLKNILSYYY